jgi:hypothetical protein
MWIQYDTHRANLRSRILTNEVLDRIFEHQIKSSLYAISLGADMIIGNGWTSLK